MDDRGETCVYREAPHINRMFIRAYVARAWQGACGFWVSTDATGAQLLAANERGENRCAGCGRRKIYDAESLSVRDKSRIA